jgi:hypothetical protein
VTISRKVQRTPLRTTASTTSASPDCSTPEISDFTPPPSDSALPSANPRTSSFGNSSLMPPPTQPTLSTATAGGLALPVQSGNHQIYHGATLPAPSQLVAHDNHTGGSTFQGSTRVDPFALPNFPHIYASMPTATSQAYSAQHISNQSAPHVTNQREQHQTDQVDQLMADPVGPLDIEQVGSPATPNTQVLPAAGASATSLGANAGSAALPANFFERLLENQEMADQFQAFLDRRKAAGAGQNEQGQSQL